MRGVEEQHLSEGTESRWGEASDADRLHGRNSLVGQNGLEEASEAWILRCVENLGGRSLLDNAPAIHEDDPVGDLTGKAHLVSHDDHGDAGLCQLLHHIENLADHLRVESGGRLVEKKNFRLHGQSPGDPDALLLPSGQLRRIFCDVIFETNTDQELPRPLVRFAPTQAANARGAERHVSQDRHVRKEVEALEDHADFDLDRALAAAADFHAVDDDVAPVVLFELIDAADQRRLA